MKENARITGLILNFLYLRFSYSFHSFSNLNQIFRCCLQWVKVKRNKTKLKNLHPLQDLTVVVYLNHQASIKGNKIHQKVP